MKISDWLLQEQRKKERQAEEKRMAEKRAEEEARRKAEEVGQGTGREGEEVRRVDVSV